MPIQRRVKGGERTGRGVYAGSMITLVLTVVRENRSSMSCVRRPVQPLVMPLPIVVGSLVL